MQTSLNFDSSRGRHNSVSKRIHACQIVPKKASMQDKVLACIEMSGARGMTVYELSDALKVPVHSISGRLAELSMQGRTVTGETRLNIFGNECTVYRKAGV